MPSPSRLIQPLAMSQQERDRMALGPDDAGRLIRNTTTGELEQWIGDRWEIIQTGTLTDGGAF